MSNMEPFLSKSQKIIVSCILEKDKKILLVRKNKLFDNLKSFGFGYFDIPHFLVDFGEDPEFVIRKRLAEYFDYEAVSADIVAVKQNLSNENSAQVFEIVYKVKGDDFPDKEEKCDLFFFAGKEDLASYVFLQRCKDINSYLDR